MLMIFFKECTNQYSTSTTRHCPVALEYFAKEKWLMNTDYFQYNSTLTPYIPFVSGENLTCACTTT